MLTLELALRPSRVVTLTYAYCDPDTDAELTAEWTGPFEAALARGVEVLAAKRCADGRYAWYAEETGEAYLSTGETVAELGAAHLDFGWRLPTDSARRRSASSLYSLWYAGDFDPEAIDHDRITALQQEAAEHCDVALVETCRLALAGDGGAYVRAVVLIVDALAEAGQ